MNQNSKKILTWVITVGMILIAAGVLMPLLGYSIEVYRWIFSAGALITLAGRIMNRYEGNVLRVKRLYRIEVWSSIFFCVAAFFMFYPQGAGRDWFAFILAGGLILVYTSIMIPRTLAKENKTAKK
ncbi:MAG: hypothetical protein K2L31_08570 [Muribaculum sp.]|nr:hypothetical protein [Muribaculum sp.]